MKTMALVLCALLAGGMLAYGDETSPAKPAASQLPDTVIEYTRNADGNVRIAPKSRTVSTHAQVQVAGNMVFVTVWICGDAPLEESTHCTFLVRKAKSVRVPCMLRVKSNSRYTFTDECDSKYILVSGPPLAPAGDVNRVTKVLYGTLEWREEYGSLVTFTEPSVGQLQVIREWMKYPKTYKK